MPIILEDRRVDFGMARDGTPWVKHECILGTPAIAEAIVEWSKKSAAGTTTNKETVWGMALECVARGDEPHVILKLNEKKLHSFLSQFGPMTILCLTEYGITMIGPMNKTEEPVRGGDAKAQIFFGGEKGDEVLLHEFSDGREESLCLGTIVLSNEGFKFYSLEELMSTIEQEAESETTADETPSSEDEEDIILCLSVEE